MQAQTLPVAQSTALRLQLAVQLSSALRPQQPEAGKVRAMEQERPVQSKRRALISSVELRPQQPEAGKVRAMERERPVQSKRRALA